MSVDTALNPIFNPPSHKPMSHMADPEMLMYVDGLTGFLRSLSAGMNIEEQARASTNIKLRLEWLQTRLAIYETAFNASGLNGIELKEHLGVITRAVSVGVKLPSVESVPAMFKLESPNSAHPYTRRYINFDWIEHYLATNHNVTPADAMLVAENTLAKELFPAGVPIGTVIGINTNMRDPEIIVERTQKIRI